MGHKSKREIKGRDEFERKMKNLGNVAPRVMVIVETRNTAGTIARKKKGPKDASRSAGQNMVIIRTQAKHMGRNINFLDAREKKSVAKVFTDARNRAFKVGKWSDPTLFTEAKEAGRRIIRALRSHILDGRGPRGPLKPVLQATREQKIRETGQDRGPMIRTGQLLKAFKLKIKRA